MSALAIAADRQQPRQSINALVRGNALMRDCQSQLSAERRSCLGYITGVIDTMDTPGIRDAMRGVCPILRPGMEMGQVVDIVLRFLIENPQMRDFPAVVSIMAALTEPCP